MQSKLSLSFSISLIEFLIPMIIEKTKGKVYQGLKDRIFIEVAKYGDDAGLVGAAKHGINNFERSQL